MGDDDGVSADRPGRSGTALPPLAGEQHVCASCSFAFADYDVDRAVPPVLDELQAYIGGFLAEVARSGPDDWARPVHRLPDEHRTALWLVRQAAHEGVHHLRDVAEVAERR